MVGESDGDFAIARYRLSSGALDTSFGPDGTGMVITAFPDAEFGSSSDTIVHPALDTALDVTIQSDGKIVVVGYTTVSLDSDGTVTDTRLALARYDQHGELDPSFGTEGTGIIVTPVQPLVDHTGFARSSAEARDVEMQVIDGVEKILIAGRSRTLTMLTRYELTGTIDESFGDEEGYFIDGPVDSFAPYGATSLLVHPDGRFLVAQKSLGFTVTQHVPDGERDSTFGTNGVSRIHFGSLPQELNGMAQQTDGKIIVAGTYDGDLVAARFNPDGSPDDGGTEDTDPSDEFGENGRVVVDFGHEDIAHDIVIQPYDHKILLVGEVREDPSHVRSGIVRLSADGSRDTSFGNGGTVETLYFDPSGANKSLDGAFAATIQLDASGNYKLITAGSAGQPNPDTGEMTTDFGLGRYILNSRPIAEDQRVSTAIDTSVEIELTGSDPEGGEFYFTVETFPNNGSLVPITASRFRYTPNPGFVGLDYFYFIARDEVGAASTTAAVYIQVLPEGVSFIPQCNYIWDGDNEDGFWFSETISPEGSLTTNWSPDDRPGAGEVSGHVCIVNADGGVYYTSYGGPIGTVDSVYSQDEVFLSANLRLQEYSVFQAPVIVGQRKNGQRSGDGVYLSGPGDIYIVSEPPDFFDLIPGVETQNRLIWRDGRIQGGEGVRSLLYLEEGMTVERGIQKWLVNRELYLEGTSLYHGGEMILENARIVNNGNFVVRGNDDGRLFRRNGDASHSEVQNLGTMTIESNFEILHDFVNADDGIVRVSNSVFTIANHLTQLDTSSGTLRAGIWVVDFGTIVVGRDTNILVNDSDITLIHNGLFSHGSSGRNALDQLQENSGTLWLQEGTRLTTSSSLTNSGKLEIGHPDADSEFPNLSWLIVQGDFHQVTGSTVLIHEDGELRVDGAATIDLGSVLLGEGRINAASVTNHGSVLPGESPGQLIIGGDFTQADDGSLGIELAGTENDQLVVEGTVTLHGQLDLDLLKGFDSVDASTLTYITGIGVHNGALQVIGTSRDDHVVINQSGDGFKVHASFLPEKKGFRHLANNEVTSIIVVLGAGNDHAVIANSIEASAILNGGEGDDQLQGGGGRNVLLEGAGNDRLIGGSSHDLLIGGDGADRINGNGGRNILIAGRTSYDDTPDHIDDLFAILDDFAVDGELNGALQLDDSTVFNDDFIDSILGVSDLDWLFSKVGEDKVRGNQ